MGRPPTPVGTYGRIGFTRLANGSVRASALYRDFDGIARPGTRYGPSKAAAERALKTARRDRTATAGQGTPDTRIRDVAKLWQIERSRTPSTWREDRRTHASNARRVALG
jgi:hypothetical protein